MIKKLLAIVFCMIFLFPVGAMAADPSVLTQLQTPFYDPNSVDCSVGFWGNGPLYGPNYPSSISDSALKAGILKFVNQYHPNSPLLDQVDNFMKFGKSQNVNPAMVISMAQIETQLATVGNGAPDSGYNFGNMKDASGNWMKFGSYTEATKATFDRLSSSLYLGDSANTSVTQIVKIWDLGPNSPDIPAAYVEFMASAMGFILGGDASAADVDACALSQVGGGNGQIDSAAAANLAAKILSSDLYHCDNSGDCNDLRAVANGQSLRGVGSCLADQINIKVLQLLVYLVSNGFQIGTFALCSDHATNDGGSGHGHVNGYAVDISTVNNQAVAANTTEAKNTALKMDQFLNNIPQAIRPDQLISYGYGGHYDPEMAALQMANGQTCSTIEACVSYYTPTTESEHENHIHVGYK